MNQTMDMATRDMIRIVNEVAYSHQKINILEHGCIIQYR